MNQNREEALLDLLYDIATDPNSKEQGYVRIQAAKAWLAHASTGSTGDEKDLDNIMAAIRGNVAKPEEDPQMILDVLAVTSSLIDEKSMVAVHDICDALDLDRVMHRNTVGKILADAGAVKKKSSGKALWLVDMHLLANRIQNRNGAMPEAAVDLESESPPPDVLHLDGIDQIPVESRPLDSEHLTQLMSQ